MAAFGSGALRFHQAPPARNPKPRHRTKPATVLVALLIQAHLTLILTVFAVAPIEGTRAGETRTLALRPETLKLRGSEEANVLSVVVEDMSFLGAVVRLKVRLGESGLLVDAFNAAHVPLPNPGEAIQIGFGREDVIVLDGS